MPYDAKRVAGQALVTAAKDMSADALDSGATGEWTHNNRGRGINLVLFRDIDGKFATTTNGAIVKKSNGEVLPDDEPLWLFRARDVFAIKYLRMYQEECRNAGLDWQTEKASDIIQAFEDFAKEHPERMKQPGITRGA